MSRRILSLSLSAGIALVPCTAPLQGQSLEFIRGDANQDGKLDVADAILVLQSLFIDPYVLPCPDAADVDDNGVIEITDAILILRFLFLGSAAPYAPFPIAGADPSEDVLACLPPSSTEGLEPPRALSSEDVEAALGSPPPLLASSAGGAIEVSPEAFDFLSTLPPGSSLLDHVESPGISEFVQALMDETSEPGSPVAIPYHLKAPADPSGCVRVEAAALKGLSRDVGPDATPESELEYSVDPDVVCGVGPHAVRFTVTDAHGLASWATALITVCESDEIDCEEAIAAPPPGTPSDPATPERRMTCSWILSRRRVPRDPVRAERAVYYDEAGNLQRTQTARPFLVGSSPLEISSKTNGAGPQHVLLGLRTSPRCSTPPTDLALLGWGQVIIRMNLLCFYDNDCTVVEDRSCTEKVDLEGSYEGTLNVRTDSGPACRAGGNAVEALAQEETQLQVNGSSLFNKALAVQNGASIRKRVSYEVSGTVGVSGAGLAADIKATHGITHEIWTRTGSRVGTLRAFANTERRTPVTAELTGAGKAELFSSGAANGLTGAATEASTLYAIGTSNCPGAGTVFVAEMSGRGQALLQALARAEDFFYQHTGIHIVIESP